MNDEEQIEMVNSETINSTCDFGLYNRHIWFMGVSKKKACKYD